MLCLTLAIYHEARSEPTEDQVSVATIITNRLKDKEYPKSICGVVKQPGAFSWTKHKKLFKIRANTIKDKKERQAFLKAERIARLHLKGKTKNYVGNRKFFGKTKGYKTPYKPIRLTSKSKHIYY